MLKDMDEKSEIYRIERKGLIKLMKLKVSGRELMGEFMVSDNGDVVVKRDKGMERNMKKKKKDQIEKEKEGKNVIIKKGKKNLVGEIIKMREIKEMYIYKVSQVKKKIIDEINMMNENERRYKEMDEKRIKKKIDLDLIYLGMKMIVIMQEIWKGIEVEERMVRKIRMMIGEQEDVDEGNIDVQVKVRQ